MYYLSSSTLSGAEKRQQPLIGGGEVVEQTTENALVRERVAKRVGLRSVYTTKSVMAPVKVCTNPVPIYAS
jgi:hypothetical protein